MILGKGARLVQPKRLYAPFVLGRGRVFAERQHKLAESVFPLAWLLRASELH